MAEIKSINGYKLNDTIARENIVNLTNDLNNKVDKVRGMDIIFVTTAETDEEARELLTQFGMPFKK